MSYKIRRGRLHKPPPPSKRKLPLRKGAKVILRKVPNHPCDALRPEHVNAYQGVVLHDPKPGDIDEFDRVLWVVQFHQDPRPIYVSEDCIEVIS